MSLTCCLWRLEAASVQLLACWSAPAPWKGQLKALPPSLGKILATYQHRQHMKAVLDVQVICAPVGMQREPVWWCR